MQLVVSWSAADPDAPAAACDPYWNYTPLLLHMDGTDGSTAAPTNSSGSGILIARDGGNLSSTQARFGTTSYWFAGSGTNSAGTRIISTPDLQMVFGAGDFTIEFSMFVVSAPSASAILVDGRAALTQGAYPTLYLSPSMTLGYYVSSADRITSASALSLSTWYHVAIVRSAGVTKLYVNGTQYGSSWTDSTNYIADGLVFGASSYHTFPNTRYGLYGYMDEVRVTKGIARYTATFTPPTEAFAATQCVVDPSYALLLHMDGANNGTTFTDSSTSARAVTAVGNAKTSTTQTKFGATSAYFDGTGDYLSVADAAGLEPGSSDFTLQAWIRPDNVNAGNYSFFSKRADTSVVGPFLLRREGNVLSLKHSTNGTTWADQDTGGTLTANTWHHVALVRSGSTLKVYLDGALAITQTVSGSLHDNSAALLIGGDTNANQWIGYIDEVVYEMSARWTAAFTPPSVPYT